MNILTIAAELKNKAVAIENYISHPNISNAARRELEKIQMTLFNIANNILEENKQLDKPAKPVR